MSALEVRLHPWIYDDPWIYNKGTGQSLLLQGLAGLSPANAWDQLGRLMSSGLRAIDDSTHLSQGQIQDRERFEEKSLVRRAKSGEVAAFEQLYRQHLPRIYGLCLRMTANRDRAEELTQEAFILAWRRIESFRGASAFSSWLHRLAVNVVFADARQRSRRQELDSGRERAFDPLPHQPPSKVAAGADLDRTIVLDRAIKSLPQRARHVFVLHEVYGYRHREIAAQLDITEGACKAQLHRARALLRERLDR